MPATKKSDLNTEAIVAALNAIMEMELAGIVRYTHYSLMVFGHSRIPIVEWMNAQAMEALTHARQAGSLVTSLGGHPSLKIGKLLETHRHEINDILRESLEHERAGVALYYGLLGLVEGKSVRLEEYARTMIAEEEAHISEVEKMMRKPGDLEPAV